MQGLYLVTPNWDDTVQLLKITGQALSARPGAIAALQYRHKTANPELRMEQAGALMEICRHHRVPFIVNDHVDLCMVLDADGVHLGGTDTPLASVRKLLGPDKIIGASCYGDMHRALDAQAAGASYVAFGGFYPSRVKQYAVTTPPAILDQASEVIRIPTVVIGGMTPANAAPLVTRGARMVAAISSVYMDSDPAAAVANFAALFRRPENP